MRVSSKKLSTLLNDFILPPFNIQRCVRSTTKGRILWTLRMVREVAEVDILSARAVTLSTSQVDQSILIYNMCNINFLFKVDIHLEGGNSSSTSTSFKFYGRLLHRYSGVMRVCFGWSKRLLEGTPASTDLRAFTQISPVASLIVIQSLSYCHGAMRWGGEKMK